ncbi:aspartate/glutamate racemase family protein [Hyphococcus sp.]|uniref:aspartate/glutamate racemase family protein n=1 Tax=Hyphococcus sp. TaxID=2038636 RepID=UPI003CCC3707
MPAQRRHFGILAHSAEGAALCLRTFCLEAEKYLGDHMHPDVSLDCIAMGHSMPLWDAGDYAPIRAIHAQSVERLAKAGAEFFACPDNTSHIALEQPGPDFALPGLHIAQIVAAEAARCGMRKVAVLGTRYTMEGPVYPQALSAHGVSAEIPDAPERNFINSVIFDELVKGDFRDAARAGYLEIIERMKKQECDGVALVCTEIPLLISADASPLPVLDSTRLLARAALQVALGRAPMPVWRGGAFEAIVGAKPE